MNLTLQQLIDKNNEWREQLTPLNETYYSEMLGYIRCSNTDETKKEVLLLELLEHLLDAQRAGKTAHEIFGDKPKEYCDELLRTMPKYRWRDYLDIMIMASMSFWAMEFLMHGIFGAMGVLIPTSFTKTIFQATYSKNILIFGSDIVFVLLCVLVFFYLLKKTYFTQENMREKKVVYFVIVLFYQVYVYSSVFLDWWFKKRDWYGLPSIDFPYWSCFFISGIAGLFCCYWLKKHEKTNVLA